MAHSFQSNMQQRSYDSSRADIEDSNPTVRSHIVQDRPSRNLDTIIPIDPALMGRPIGIQKSLPPQSHKAPPSSIFAPQLVQHVQQYQANYMGYRQRLDQTLRQMGNDKQLSELSGQPDDGGPTLRTRNDPILSNASRQPSRKMHGHEDFPEQRNSRYQS